MTQNIDFAKIKEAYDKYPPSGYEKFFFRYFSVNTLERDKWLMDMIKFIELGFFATGAVFMVVDNIRAAFFPTIAFAAVMVVVAVPRFAAFFIHNARIRKIARYLGLTMKEFRENIYYNYV